MISSHIFNYCYKQRWDRAGRVGFGGMTRPARRRDLDFPDRPARRPSRFRPSDGLGPRFWSLRATRPIIFRVSPRLGLTRSRTWPGRGRVSIHCNVIMIYESVLVLNFVTMYKDSHMITDFGNLLIYAT